MERLSTEVYQGHIARAIQAFWTTRSAQQHRLKGVSQGARGAVTGGKQLDGFIELLAQVAEDLGVPSSCIHTKGGALPGFFRPSKDWDFVILTPQKQLVSIVELKSQVGSFGNNFNNRVEEALGSALDLWTAFRENGFSQSQPPWLGYLMLVEQTTKSTRSVRLQEPHFHVRPEFQDTSYLDRYTLFCQKLMQERQYAATSLIWTNSHMEFGYPAVELSLDTFLLSFMGFIQGKLSSFQP